MTHPAPLVPNNSLDDPSKRRRYWLLGAAGVAATLGGASYTWMRGDAAAPTEPIPGFWDLQWETPSGPALSARSFLGKPLLINFWATWCPPCIEELPLINRFFGENKANGWQVLGLAVDRLAPVQSFLAKNPLDFPVGMAGLAGADLGRSLGNISGGLPFSVVVGSNGAIVHRKLGRLLVSDLEQWRQLK